MVVSRFKSVLNCGYAHIRKLKHISGRLNSDCQYREFMMIIGFGSECCVVDAGPDIVRGLPKQ